MNFNTITTCFREYPTICVCVVLSVFLLAGVVVRSGNLSDARESLELASREGTRIDDNIKNSLNLSEHLDSLRAVSENVDARLIRPAELARNLQYFYRMESETGVRITALDQRSARSGGDDEEENVYLRVPYEMALSGEFGDVISFFHSVENGRHFARIRNFEITGSQRTETTALNMTLNIDLLGQQ